MQKQQVYSSMYIFLQFFSTGLGTMDKIRGISNLILQKEKESVQISLKLLVGRWESREKENKGKKKIKIKKQS